MGFNFWFLRYYSNVQYKFYVLLKIIKIIKIIKNILVRVIL